MKDVSYGAHRALPGVSYEDAVERVTEALSEEGFGILTEIDVRQAMREKLDEEFRRYVILGACNPKLAFQALQSEDKIGTMLPCNVIVEENEDGSVEISAVDPMASMQAVKNAQLAGVAKEVKSRLEKVIKAV